MTDMQVNETVLFLKPRKWIVTVLLILFLLAGLSVRLIDITDLPLDFAATRQLHSMIMARGIYYQMDMPENQAMDQSLRRFAITTGNSEPNIEPPLMEYLAAYTYRLLGHEDIFFPRLYSILFWVTSGIPLFLLAKRLMTVNGAFATLALYLFNPFGAFASRSFQPDPLMTASIIWALYFQFRWFEDDNLKNAILAGIFTGIAFFIKAPSAFFVGIPFAGLVIFKGIKQSIKNWRVYMMAAIAIVPAILFNVISATVGGNAGSIFGARFFPELFIDPKWYYKWFMMARSVLNYFPILIAVLGYFVLKNKPAKIIFLCMWIGYLLYGFTFAYHIYTHNYYQLPLIPIVALGFGAVAGVLFSKLEEVTHHWFPRVLILGVLLIGVGFCVVKIRGDLINKSYRHEAAYWQELGDKLNHNSNGIALTHDYGYRLSYWGYTNPKLWPTVGDLTVKELVGSTDPAFEKNFELRTEGKAYFLVTLVNDFKSQKNLYTYLFDYYPYSEGDGYYIFDLKNPLPAPPVN